MNLDLVFIAAIIAMVVITLSEFFRKPKAKIELRALEELALVRDELSKLRGETLRDRDELRTEISKHERAFVETTHRVNDALKEVTKLSLAYGGQQVRK